MFANQFEEHIAHSAPCSSRWDGWAYINEPKKTEWQGLPVDEEVLF